MEFTNGDTRKAKQLWDDSVVAPPDRDTDTEDADVDVLMTELEMIEQAEDNTREKISGAPGEFQTVKKPKGKLQTEEKSRRN